MPQSQITAPSTQSATLTASMAQVVTDANTWLAAATGAGKWAALFDWMVRQITPVLGGPPLPLGDYISSSASLASRTWTGDGPSVHTAPSGPSATLTASMATAMTDAAAWLTAADALAPKDGMGARAALGDWLLRQLYTIDSGRLRPTAVSDSRAVTSAASLASRTWTALT